MSTPTDLNAFFEEISHFSNEEFSGDDKAKLLNRLTEDPILSNNVINIFNILSKITNDSFKINYLKSFLTKKESSTSNIAELQLQDKGIWVLYGEEYTFLDQKLLEGLKVSNMKDLKMAIKTVLKLSGNDVITINSGSETLEDSESFSVAGLFNAKDNALEIKVEEKESLTSSTAELQLQDRGIWVLYGEEYTFLDQKLLEGFKVSNMKDLKMAIKTVLKLSGNDVITINSGSETLEDSKSVAELFNAKDNALEIKIKDNEKVGPATIELNHIEEAFQIEYQGTALETFYLRLKQFYDEWYRHLKTYAPYLTIIQNSGSGKTRLVGELKTKGIYILYICKRHENNPGYPDSTPYSQEIFKTIQDHKFKDLLSVAIKEIKIKDWSAEEFWNIQIRDKYKNECNDFWQSVFESLSQQKEPLLDYRNENFVKELFTNTEIPVVCCIDEAHELLKGTYFIKWRKEIRKIRWHGFFNILLSTNRKIDDSSLPPVIKDTSSARSFNFEIFPAFLDVHTMDVLASLSDKNAKDYNYKRTVYLGIPLWGSLSQAGVELMDILHLASKKIRNFSRSNNDYLANLACMACSLALEVSPRVAEVDSLVASHMATVIGVSLDRTNILCTYPSDTILASGALRGIINVGWKNCLDTLLELFSCGVLVEAGERGELVNRIIFLKAYTDSVEDNAPATYLQKVPLKLFLKSLLYEEMHGFDELLENMGIDEAEVGFNHWTALLAINKDYVNSGGNKFLTEDLIIEAYHRHTAFKMPLGFPVIDHIIPFRYNAGYGIISIQNKNSKKKTFDNKDISSLINPLNVFGEWKKDYKILGIYIDLDLDREKLIETKAVLKSRDLPRTRSNDTKKDRDHIIYIQGIEAFKCGDEINKRLSKILFTRPWPLDAQWSMFDKDKNLERTNAIKSFLPLAFKQEQSLVDKWQLNTQQL